MPIVDIQINDNGDNPQTHLECTISNENQKYLDLIAKSKLGLTNENMIYIIGLKLKKKYEPGVVPGPLVQFLTFVHSMMREQGLFEEGVTWEQVFRVLILEDQLHILIDTANIPVISVTAMHTIKMFNQLKKHSLDVFFNISSTMTLKSVVENVVFGNS